MSAWKRQVAVLMMGAAAFATPAPAQDVAAGRLVAQRSCSSCHQVGKGAFHSDISPTFEDIARRPSTSNSSLNAILSTPHHRMPDYLTRQEISDVSAYILSLKK